MSEKRERSANFSHSEIRELVNIIMKFKHIIENKATDTCNIKQKQLAWTQVTNNFNAASLNTRNTKTLKMKYDGLKKQLKKKVAEQKRQLYGTGGGPMVGIKLEDYEEKLYSIMKLNVEGLPSRGDSDSIMSSMY